MGCHPFTEGEFRVESGNRGLEVSPGTRGDSVGRQLVAPRKYKKFMLKFNLKFSDLYDYSGLKKLDAIFYEYFSDKDTDLYARFKILSDSSNKIEKKQKDEILIESAKVIEDFLVQLFNVESQNDSLRISHKDFSVVSQIKLNYIQRKIAKKFKDFEGDSKKDVLLDLLANTLGEAITADCKISDIELRIANKIKMALDFDNNKTEEFLQNIEKYSRWALFTEEGQKFHESGALFKLPQKIDLSNLVDAEKCAKNLIQRDGFNLVDQGFDLNQAICEAKYCIFCHNQEKDSCRTGIHEKNNKDEFVSNDLGVKLEGCPLDQKISEMNLLKSQGYSIASLVVTAIDNPLMAATGHRICNDCMKSCIFQKQDPVDIPQIESENLKDVLALPYGFEIYSLVSRWNPLNFDQQVINPSKNKKVLVAGLGPAGFALSYYLLNKGYDVVAIDGLKIEPIDPKISGIDQYGGRCDFAPIKDINEIKDPLSQRVIQGFGGVCEYGITSRWDKNFLTIIRLLLERRKNFRMFGGLRFGSSITDQIAFDDYGFDHVALCIGAGRPNTIALKNNFCKGVRSASDFLMNLQLGGAFKEDLFTNLQIRLPIVVIGAGLTAMDTATESQEYYVTQIRKFKKKVDVLQEFYGTEKFWSLLDEQETQIAQEFLGHEKVLDQQGKATLFEKAGATKIIYRKEMQKSPAYRQNHEELIATLKQGVQFIENCNPREIISDEYGCAQSLKCENGEEFPAKAILVAAGTSPNISIVNEDKLDLNIDEKYFAQIDLQKNNLQKSKYVKHGNYSFFTKIDDKSKSISFFGDLHPNFEGSVVKAIASAKIGHKQIDEFLSQNKSKKKFNICSFLQKKESGFTKINNDFLVKINKIKHLSDSLNEVEVRAPLLVKRTEIGHIFRLQNYYNLSEKLKDQTLAMEGMAITATKVDKNNGLISGTLLDYGGSTSLVRYFKEGEPCVFMGPGGKKTEIFKNETVLLIGSGRGNAVLSRMAEKFKDNGCKVILCLSYKDSALVNDIEGSQKFSDILILSVLNGIDSKLKRSKDFFSGKELVTCLKEYFSENKQEIDRVFVIGNDKIMKKIADVRKDSTIDVIAQCKSMIVSLNAPMQCMMKGVCSQCLQKRKGANGSDEYYYSCASQDQESDVVDFEHLTNRCDQNKLQEKITKMWIGYLKR